MPKRLRIGERACTRCRSAMNVDATVCPRCQLSFSDYEIRQVIARDTARGQRSKFIALVGSIILVTIIFMIAFGVFIPQIAERADALFRLGLRN